MQPTIKPSQLTQRERFEEVAEILACVCMRILEEGSFLDTCKSGAYRLEVNTK